MGSETELKLRLSPADARKVSRLGLLRGRPKETLRLENVYYDTAEHALADRKMALRRRRIGQRWLITIKSAGKSGGGLSTRSEWEYPCPPDQFDFSGVDQAALRAFLEKITPQLVPLYSTNFQRRTWMIEPHAALSIELALDEGEITACPLDGDGQPGRTLSKPLCELELELKRGESRALFDIALQLAAKLALMPENESKAQRGRRLYKGIADAPQVGVPSVLDEAQTPGVAFAQLADECLNHFLANAEGVRTGDDAEYIHQARVALRRLRALIKLFAPILPPDFVSTYNEGWRALANQLGDARDHDVLLTETLPSISRHYDGHPSIDTFVAYAQACRLQAHEVARSSFHAPALGQLSLQFLADLTRLDEHPDGGSLKKFAHRRLKKRLARIRREAVAFENKSNDQLHRLRIQFKRLRYALESFAPFYADDDCKNYLGHLKSMQDVFGQINDLERGLAVEARAPAAAHCELVEGWLSASQQALIARLPELTRRFLAQPAPWQ
jgi:triphosphatase